MHELSKARRFVRMMMIFWNVVTALMVMLFAIYTLVSQPSLWHSWRGSVFGALVLTYGAWYSLGFRWLMGPARVWQGSYFGRRALYWLPLVLLPLALLPFDPIYVNLEWVAIGSGLGLLLSPWNIIGVGLAMIPLLVSWNVLPHANTPEDWLQFALTLLTVIIYCAVIYMPYVLVTQRFKQARLYADLQTAHADLAAAHAQLAASAAQERELAVLRERERLARDMHDTLGHALALTTVKLEAIRRLTPMDPARAAAEIDATEGIVRGAMGELRATLAALRTSPCLATELQGLADATGERAKLTVATHLCDLVRAWPMPVQGAFLRIGSEAIANVERHAQASHLTLTLAEEDETAILRIADDGVGLPELPMTAEGNITSPPGHFGLAGMRERVAEMGGALAITSAPGQGTTVEARIPLSMVQVAAPTATYAQVG